MEGITMTLIPAIWALAIIVTGAFLLDATIAVRKAATDGSVPQQLDWAKARAVRAAIALAGLASLGVVAGLIITVTS